MAMTAQYPKPHAASFPNLRHPRASESGLTIVQPDPLRRAVIWAQKPSPNAITPQRAG